ncbi:polyketide cyclase, partial [Klebsiella pneumoniae]
QRQMCIRDRLELRDGLIFREYLGIDELAIWSQIFN